jgi:predicted lipoprotein with Yx(FWY)xxD motif
MRPVRSLTVLLAALATGLTAYGGTAAASPVTVAPAAPALHAARAGHVSPAGHAGRKAAKPVTALKTRTSSLGKIVVGKGNRTVYVYDVDHKGTKKSACTGACKQAWPLVTFKGTAKTRIKAPGVTGKLGSIAAGKGKRQVTLDGWPLYYFAGDSAAGQTHGQGVGGIWWAVTPKGKHITKTPSAPAAPPKTTPTPPKPPTSPAPSDALGTASAAGLGTIVVDGKGMTVYAYDVDTQGTTTSACTGDCASAWPAVEVTGSGTPKVSGVTGTVSTIKAADGGRQLTLDGWPLYYFAGDHAAGQTNGQGLGGIWWVMSPAGEKITPAAPAPADALSTASASGLGTIVVDGKGMTVYAFDHDTQGTTTSACTGSCASVWPAVEVTGSGTPTVSGVTGTVGTITANDGGRQLTLNGWPLYTYSSDTAAGQTNGQGFGGLWWAVTPAGQKIVPAPQPTVLSTASTGLGTIVVDGNGMTVYAYDADTQGTTTSACTGDCASAWPAVEVTGSGTPKVSGVTGTVGTIAAPDGGKQLTLNGWPLYTYAGDHAAGQTNGEGLGGVWWVMSPSGTKVMPAPSQPAVLSTASTGLGTIVVDGNGMTVYAYNVDTPGTSACTGACANSWYPVEVSGSGTPTVSGVTGTVGTIPAADGNRQLTLNGWPLYTYYDGDYYPGDTYGQGVGGVWWVMSPAGTKITTIG